MTILGNAIKGYLHGMGEPKWFAFHQWNYLNYDGSSISNNVEGWHSRLKKVVGKPHPNVYELVDIIRREEAVVQTEIQMTDRGAQQPSRRRRVWQ